MLIFAGQEIQENIKRSNIFICIAIVKFQPLHHAEILLLRIKKELKRWAVTFPKLQVFSINFSKAIVRIATLNRISRNVILHTHIYKEFIHLCLANHKVDLLKDLFNIASVVWLIVALASILTLTIIYFITLGEMKDSLKLRDNIYISDKIRTPAVYGIIKPKIILPTEYDATKLDFILMHEKAHIKRKDNFIRLFALIVVCLHWFNPFAWLLLKMLYSDIELACDETVLSKCNETERKEYAYTLLSTAEKTNVFAASFGGSKIRIRIESVLSYKKISYFSIVAFSALIIAICYVLLTNAS